MPEKERSIITTAFVIYEGHRTEPNYFNLFHKYNSESSNFDFKKIEKKSFDKHTTDRKELVEIMKGEITCLSRNEYTLHFFVTFVLGIYAERLGIDIWLKEDECGNEVEKKRIKNEIKSSMQNNSEPIEKELFIKNTSKILSSYIGTGIILSLKNKFEEINYVGNISIDTESIINLCSETIIEKCDDLKNMRKQILYDYEIKRIVKSGLVSKKEKERLFDLITKKYIGRDSAFREEYTKELKDTFDKSGIWDSNSKKEIKNDRKFVVFDRDYNFNESKSDYNTYLRIIEDCEKLGYDVLLSTPDFEIWLLMHHDVDCSKYDYRTKRDILNDLLCKLEGIEKTDIKKIDDSRFLRNYNKERFQQALKKSLELETNPKALLIYGGSNVGEKLNSLLHPGT